MKYLQPMHLRNVYFADIEREIIRILKNLIYDPLINELNKYGVKDELRNAVDPIVEAITTGRVYYEDGYFYGSFNSAISKRFKQLGAKYSLMRRGWKFDAVPAELQLAVAHVNDKVNGIVRSLIRTLDDIDVAGFVGKNTLHHQFLKSTEEMSNAFDATVKAISIKPKFTAAQQQALSDNYATNMELYIQKWAKQSILKLRESVTQNVYKGNRASELVKKIQGSYRVSREKAKFLARQETSLLMSKMREERYKGIGITRYRWEGANDERERPDHKALNGKIFSWDNPPITNRETGARNNPGEDFNCRCIAVPIIEGYDDE